MSHARKVVAVAGLAALAWAVAPVAEAQPPIRIGASLAQTGGSAALSQSQLRGYQLCVKHLNEKGGVLGRKLELFVYDDASDHPMAARLDHDTVFGRFRVDGDGVQRGHQMLLVQWQDGKKVIVWPDELAPVKARFPTPPWSQRP